MVGACFQARLTRQPAESYGSYGHTAWRCAILPRLPGIEASPAAPPARHSLQPAHRGRDSDFALPPRSELRLRFFAEKPITGPAPKVREICCPRSITPGVFFSITGPAPEVRQRGCPRSIADGVFFHHSHALPSILLWQQDCPCQSWRGNRIALVNPGVATGLLPPILLWQQECPGASRAARAWNCSSPSAGL